MFQFILLYFILYYILLKHWICWKIPAYPRHWLFFHSSSSFPPPFPFPPSCCPRVHQGADRCALRTRRWTLKTRLTPKSARWATPRTPPAAAMSWWGDTHTHTHMNTHTHTPSCTTFEFELNFWVEYCFFVYNVKQWNCVQSTNKKEEKKTLQTHFHNIYSHNKNETTL